MKEYTQYITMILFHFIVYFSKYHNTHDSSEYYTCYFFSSHLSPSSVNIGSIKFDNKQQTVHISFIMPNKLIGSSLLKIKKTSHFANCSHHVDSVLSNSLGFDDFTFIKLGTFF